jgi:hypothetical protein
MARDAGLALAQDLHQIGNGELAMRAQAEDAEARRLRDGAQSL